MTDAASHNLCHFCFTAIPGVQAFLCNGIFAHDLCRTCENYEVRRSALCSFCGRSSQCGDLKKCFSDDCAKAFHVPCVRKWYIECNGSIPPGLTKLCCEVHSPPKINTLPLLSSALPPITDARVVRDTSPSVSVPMSSLSIASQISDRDPRKRHFFAISPTQTTDLGLEAGEIASSSQEAPPLPPPPLPSSEKKKRAICLLHFAYNHSGCRFGSNCRYTHDVKDGIENLQKMEVLMRRKGLTLDHDKWYASSGEPRPSLAHASPASAPQNKKKKGKLCLSYFAIKPNKMNFCERGEKCPFVHDVAQTYQSKSEVMSLMEDMGWRLNEKRWKKYNSNSQPEFLVNANDIVVPPPAPSRKLCPYFFAENVDCFTKDCNLCHNVREGLESKSEFIEQLTRQGLKLDEDKWRESLNS